MTLLYLSVIGLLHVCSAKNTYIATVPQRIRPGSTADICVASLKYVTGPVAIKATLMDKENKSIATITGSNSLDQGQGIFKMKIPKDIPRGFEYKMEVQARGGIVFDKTVVKISTLMKTSSIFIQTDKPIYKPGDLVQFRVFGTNSKLKILDDPIDIFIQDPKRNRVKQFIKEKPVFGVFAGSFQLSTLTNIGDWQIQVEQGREKNTKTFSVERFVLPKFEVNVAVPLFQLTTDKFLQASITAMYTFGKPVEGDVSLTIKSRWGRKTPIVKRFKIKGKATIKVLMSDIVPVFGRSIQVSAKVTESVTSIEADDSGSVQIYDTTEKLSFSSSMPYIFKPGMKYNIILRATQQDDSALTPPLGQVNVTVTYFVSKPVEHIPLPSPTLDTQVLPFGSIFPPPRRRHEESKLLWTKIVQIPESGILTLDAVFPIAAERGSIEAYYREGSAYKSISRAESPSTNFLKVSVINNQKAKPGQMLPLLVQSTERMRTVHYKIFSKASIIVQGSFRMGNTTSRKQRILIRNDMAPQAKLLVYYTRRDGEIVADAILFQVEEIFENEVAIKFNKERVQPGENVDLEITADPRSQVNILAVDKSILLLRTGNDITVQDVLRDLQRYDNSGFVPAFETWDYRIPRPVDGRDAFSIFNEAGVYMLTDAHLFQHRQSNAEKRTLFSSDFMQSDASPASGMGLRSGIALRGSGGNAFAKPSRTRKMFPETWLWINKNASNGGTATVTATAPDTITQWIASAFAVNPVTGLGVASEMANLTTFQRFFMRLEMPYSAIRGEVLVLQVTLFNFLEEDQEVVVQLSNNKDISFADGNGNPFMAEADGWTKRVVVKNDSVNSVFFPIIPTAIGNVQLDVTARSPNAADAVQRQLLIEAEGIKQNYNVPLLIDLRQQNTFEDAVKLSFPPNRVKDSEFIKVQLTGDLLGPTLAGLEDLLQVSTGSGENNMVTFVPNVYLSSYMKATKGLTDELNTKIKNLLEGGYQRELSFVRNDGSFSAFGTNDRIGSTWLTAFVIKSFAQAAEFTFIDINVMTKALRWLLNQQTSSGDFREPGIVIHKEMQGGSVSSQRSLTAYVLIALHEVKTNDQVDPELKQSVDSAIQQATDFIAKEAPASIDNLYELIIVSYALHLVNHPSKNTVFAAVEKKAVTKDGDKYWMLPETESDKIQPWKSWQPPKTKFRALDIEMTSYALLCYNLRDDILNGVQVLKWLGRQRNPNGGFISTQDTVVALQALSSLGVKIHVPNFRMNVKTQASNWQGKTLSLNNENALVLQKEDVPNSVRDISISANGNGFALFEAVVYFNVEEELREPAFRLTPTLLRESIKGFRLSVCFSWIKTGKSTMGYLEVAIPTGMEADLDSLDTSRTRGLFKKVEKAFRQINLFFDSITSEDMCIEVDVNRVSLVARHKPVPIRLSELDESSNEAIEMYQSKILANATVVEVCGAGNCEEVKKK